MYKNCEVKVFLFTKFVLRILTDGLELDYQIQLAQEDPANITIINI